MNFYNRVVVQFIIFLLQRASLLEALSKVQAAPEELEQMISISSVQSKGLKKNLKHFELDNVVPMTEIKADNEPTKLKSISGKVFLNIDIFFCFRLKIISFLFRF